MSETQYVSGAALTELPDMETRGRDAAEWTPA